MRAVLYGSVAFCLALVFAGVLRADDQTDTKPVLDKALKAMGGEAKVAKLKTGTGKGKKRLSWARYFLCRRRRGSARRIRTFPQTGERRLLDLYRYI